MKLSVKTFLCISIFLLFAGCCSRVGEKKFLDRYEFEDYSCFCEVSMIYRGVSKDDHYCIFGWYKSDLAIDTPISYLMFLDKNYHDIKNIEFMKVEGCFESDSLRLQQLAKKFLSYNISRITVDKDSNVYVYLNDYEKCSLVKFADKKELDKHNKGTKWVNVKGNWYKPKH